MAAKKQTAEAVTEPVVTEPAQTTEAKKFSLSNLAKNCRQLFGVSSCTFAGATAGLTGEYTVEEIKGIIKKWCGKEIK